MSTSCWKSIPTQDSLIVHGYIHQISSITSLYIPDDIINFISIWYYDVATWKIKGDQLHKFLFELTNGEAIYGQPFKCNDITFHCSLCPSGWKSNQNGFVQYYLEIKELPSYIDYFTVYFEFYCYETRSAWKGIRTLTKLNDAVGWYHNTLPLSECRNIVAHQPLKHQKLIFGINVELLNIKYKLSDKNKKIHGQTASDECKSNEDTETKIAQSESDENENDLKLDNIPIFEARQLNINRVIEHCWILNNYPLTRFKDCRYPKNFHSPSFHSGYWCFECQANFEHNIMIYARLKLLKLPKFIKKMKIKCKLLTNMKCESDKDEDGNSLKCDHGKDEIVELDYKHNYSKWKAYLTEDQQKNKHENSIRISIKIEIIELIDENDQKIKESEWYKYGVIDNIKEIETKDKKVDIQYCDEMEQNGKNQILTHLFYQDENLKIDKEWIRPNFLNTPMRLK